MDCMMSELTKLIKEDMKPALGVTEPGAIAFSVAKARTYVSGEVKKVVVRLNSGMYKNAFTCGIPNSPFFGNLYAAALGVVAADASLGLESLQNITPEDNEKAKAMVDAGLVEVLLDHMGSEITIDAQVETESEVCLVKIRHTHTNIVEIVKNDEVLFKSETEETDTCEEEAEALIHQYSLADLLAYVSTVPIKDIAFICSAFGTNLELLEEGLSSKDATIAQYLFEQNGGAYISKDPLKTAQLLCNGAIEARVLGFSKPAMSITGSGAHGIIATMPIYAYARIMSEKSVEALQRSMSENSVEALQRSMSEKSVEASKDELKQKIDDVERMALEKLCRATALSYLITMYIKEYSGRLSAFCGCGIAAGTGMACGLAYMQGAGMKEMTLVIQNMASGLTGMICDGGNHGCAMKGIVAVDAAFRSVDLAMKGIAIESVHGINGRTPEATMKHMGEIASPGMVKTEETIVNIMEKK